MSMMPADIAHAALCDVGRPDLAELVQFYKNEDGTLYLEPMEDVCPADLEVMVRAERIALDRQL